MTLSDRRKIRSNKHLHHAHMAIDIKIDNIISVKFCQRKYKTCLLVRLDTVSVEQQHKQANEPL